MSKTYSTMPSVMQWKADSNIANLLIARSQDAVLVGIDELLEAYHLRKDNGEGSYLLGELFFATNHWLRNCKQTPSMHKGREPAVLALFTHVAHCLSQVFGCSVNTLPNMLEQFFGTRLGAHGVVQDCAFREGRMHYMKKAQAAKFKLQFKGGRAYSLVSTDAGAPAKYGLASSSDFHDECQDRFAQVTNSKGEVIRVLDSGYAPFVMSVGRDFYMGAHGEKKWSKGLEAHVHSSWLSGMSVACAGSIMIEKGVVTHLRNNSGHYQPSDDHMVNVLQQLKLVGVDVANVRVHDFEGKPLEGIPGNVFLESRGNWEMILGRGLHFISKTEANVSMLKKRADYEAYRFKKVTLPELVERRMAEMRRAGVTPPAGTTLWGHAYKAVCMDFVPFDVTWKDKAQRSIPLSPHPHRV